MKRVTLRFANLQLLADCMFQLGINRPVIDYDRCLLSADLTARQIEHAKDCNAEVVEIVIID